MNNKASEKPPKKVEEKKTDETLPVQYERINYGWWTKQQQAGQERQKPANNMSHKRQKTY